MRKKIMTKQLLAAAIFSATLTAGVFAEGPTVEPGYVPAMNSGEHAMAATVPTTATLENAVVNNNMPNFAVAQPVDLQSTYVSSVTDEQIQPFVGRVISELQVAPTSETENKTLVDMLHHKIGDKVTVEGIRSDIEKLGGTGLFSEITPKFLTVPEGVQITYQVTVNPVVTSVAFEGNTILPTDELVKAMGIQTNQLLNTVHVSKKIQEINEAYSNAGYMLARVVGVQVGKDGKLTIKISEGVVEDIIVKGNKKTKDYVIKREVIQKVGMPLNRDLARRSVERVYNTGYFEDVNVRLLPGKENANNVVLEIAVLEQKTGVITVGAGYSKSDGAVGIIEVGENNFRGTGDKIKVHWEFGGKASNRNYQFSYTRPWLDDKGTSLGFSIFDRQEEYTDYNSNGESISSYEKRRRGFNISLGRQLGEYSRAYLTAETRDDKWIKGIGGYAYDKDQPGLPFGTFNYIGKNFGRINSLTYQYVYDSRDNVFDPARGKRLAYSLQWGGHGLGGNFDFYKATLEARFYKRVGHAQTLALRARLGWIHGHVPYTELFAVGGAETLRGYEDDQFKGRKSYSVSLEYRYPIMKKVQGVVFTDIGSAWDAPDILWYNDTKSFNIAAGVGLRLSTPIGPVRLDYGYGKKGGKFHFSFGGQF